MQHISQGLDIGHS